MRSGLSLGVVVAVALSATAHAQAPAPVGAKPTMLPTRDVDVTYDLKDQGQVLHQRMRWDVKDKLLRVDPPVAGLYTIQDFGRNVMDVVRDQDRIVLEMPASRMVLPGADGGTFSLLGEDKVAGLDCTEWQLKDPGGLETQLCVTADGVLLRLRAGERVLLQASSVAFATQPASVFQPPADYTRTTKPPQK